MDGIHTDKKYYYVSVVDANRRGFLLGPYPTHQEALDNVDKGRKLAIDNNDRAWFYGYGTAGSDAVIKTVFGL